MAGLLSVNAAVITVSGDITTNQTWTNNNVYRLSGFVYVKGGAELTIQAGTLIYGEKVTKGTLLICRGSKIHASGNVCQPIVFTSEQPAGTRTYGDWGGVILLGKSQVNQTAGYGIIEGGVDNANGDGRYGWSDIGLSGPVLNDNSGEMQYCRIEFPGIAFLPNNEINGLTFGGVGSGTVINHIQVSYSGDDSYEWFGGTVNCDHLIAFRGLDDEWDTDNSFSGHIQFCVSLRDPNVADVSGSNAFESDNDATGSTNAPYTSPVFSNITNIGPLVTPTSTINANFKRGAHIRRNSRCSIFNTVWLGWGTSVTSGYGIYIDGTSTQCNAMNGDLVCKNNIIAGSAALYGQTGTAGCGFTTTSDWFTGVNPAATTNNISYTNNSSVGLTDPFNLSNPNFLPANNSPVWGAQDFSDPKLSGFTAVNYAGAFGSTDWTKPWAEWDPNNQAYSTNGVSNLTYSPVVSNVLVSPSNCPNSGSIDISASATYGNLSYLWSNNATTQDISGLNAGTYTVTVSSYGCNASLTDTVAQVAIAKPLVTATMTSCSAALTWPAVPNVGSYQLRYKKTTDVNFGAITNLGNVLNTNVLNLDPSTGYNFQVRGLCPDGTTYGKWYTRTTSTVACGNVTALQATNTTSTSLTITWNTNCSPISSRVQYKLTAGSLWYTIDPATSPLTITGLTANTSYAIRVKQQCTPGVVSTLYTTLVVSTSPSNSQKTTEPFNLNSNVISVFPNPATDKAIISFETENSDLLMLSVFNSTGQLVFNTSFNNVEGEIDYELNTQNLSNGLYIINLNDGINTYSKQLLINK